MLFDSFQFAVFFPIVCALFWTLPQRFRWLLLLLASYYFYMAWRPFLWTKWQSANAIPILFKREDQHMLFADGSVEWCSSWRSHTPALFHEPTENSQVPVIAAEWMRPVENQRRLFEAFVLDIQKSGAQVEFVLLPSHPWFYGLAQKEFREAGKTLPSAETEAYLRGFAERHGIRIHGSLDPAKAGVVEEDFVDILHMRRE
jgi:hypothetical protein